ncbi:NYN domain-containing protein [Roseomonas sp. BN140053]|uniref:NYN domain-containing protein n=1 Tax=Roseomonas sp. BN140053 TaxID=3391898 RepID=UPI0039EA29B2
MARWIYVDVSNLWIEGQKLSAVERGWARDIREADQDRIFDYDYRLSFPALAGFLTDAGTVPHARMVLFGSRTLGNEPVWQAAVAAGFEVIVPQRGYSGGEKRVDTSLVVQMCRDAYRRAAPADSLALVAGDADYEPAVRQLVADGNWVDVVFWRHASGLLRQAASRFTEMDEHLRTVGR